MLTFIDGKIIACSLFLLTALSDRGKAVLTSTRTETRTKKKMTPNRELNEN
jgi:hypothetical protein